MLFKKAVLPMVIVAALSGCGDAALDGSSNAALNQSISVLAESIPAEHRLQFQADIDLIRAYYDKHDPARLLTNLNGKNALDIMTEAQNLRAYIELEAKRQASEDQKKAYLESLNTRQHEVSTSIAELEARLDRHEQKKKFILDSAIILPGKDADNGHTSNSIELSMTNNTAHAIYGVLLTGELSSEQGPSMVAPLDIQIEGGIEPGHSKKFVVKPSIISEWRSVEVPDPSTFLMAIDELMDVDSNLLFLDDTFTEQDHKDLASLRASLKAIEEEILIVVGPNKPVQHAPQEPESSVDIAQPVQPEVAIEIKADADTSDTPALPADDQSEQNSQPVITEQADSADTGLPDVNIEPVVGLNENEAQPGAAQEPEVGQVVEPMPAEAPAPEQSESLPEEVQAQAAPLAIEEPVELPDMVIYAERVKAKEGEDL